MSFPGGITVLEFYAPPVTGAPADPPLTTGPAMALTAGAKVVVQPTRPIAIMRWGVIITAAVVNTATVLTLTMDWAPSIGGSYVIGATTTLQSQTGWNASSLPAFFTDLAGGSITTAANATLAASKGFYHQINPQTKMPPNDASTNPVPSPDTAFVPGGGAQTLGLTVYPGQEVRINVTVAGGTTAGNGIPFFHYIPLAFQGSGSNYENVASGIPASITPVVGDPGIWTRLVS